MSIFTNLALSTTSIIAVVAAFTVLYVCNTLYNALFGPLSPLPGPALAKFTNLWRVKIASSPIVPIKFQRLHHQYGPVVRIGPSHVSVADPALIPLIYGISSKFTKSSFYDTFTPLIQGKLYPNVFTQKNQEAHRKLKSGIAQKYSLSSLISLEPLVDKVTETFMRKLRSISEESQDPSSPTSSVDLGSYLQYYAFDVIGSITFSKTFGFVESGSDQLKVIENLEGGQKYGAVIGQIPELHPYLLGNPFVQAIMAKIPALSKYDPIPILLKMIKDSIRSKEEIPIEGRNHEDFQTFLKKQHAKDGERMTEDDMVNHMFVNLLAGSDTTAISLRAMIYYLLKNPKCYARLQKEIDEADAAGLLSPIISHAESQAHIPYLALVMKEALRIHPAVALSLERIVPAGGVQMNDFHIPAGTVVGINAWVVHFDKNVFGDDAHVFRPERWEATEATGDAERLRLMERTFFAFGGGARSCTGKNISLLEMGKFIPQLLREFQLTWAGKLDWDLDASWFSKQKGVQVLCVFKGKKL